MSETRVLTTNREDAATNFLNVFFSTTEPSEKENTDSANWKNAEHPIKKIGPSLIMLKQIVFHSDCYWPICRQVCLTVCSIDQTCVTTKSKCT